MNTTKIGNRDVPVRPGHKTTVVFSAGRHGAAEDESGTWEFWTAVRVVGEFTHNSTVRCRADADPGERFRRMEGKKGYESSWKLALNADELQPAKRKNLESWLNSHRDDAQFAGAAEVDGKPARVVENGGRYTLRNI